MIVKTLFAADGRLVPGTVEVKLMPGIPMLHVIGQPDSHIRECGLKLKSALRSCDFQWPRGHQIVVNLRPSAQRKHSSGAELAIALGFLALTQQLPEGLRARLALSTVYGEVTLTGEVVAPPDLAAALQAAGGPLLTGVAPSAVRAGHWWELERLDAAECREEKRLFDWEAFWRRPEFPDLEFHQKAAEALVLAAHMSLNVLVGGPQGSGKSTWAKALYALSGAPELDKMAQLEIWFGEEALQPRWRPCESPHHTIPALAMIGGGFPIAPGVISRAHGGVLIMDEFLEFDRSVLEALREPIETGSVVHARRSERVHLPARFQLVATTNLCPCGKLCPGLERECNTNLIRCRSVSQRLSGPVADRFDLVLFSHEWLGRGERVSWQEIRVQVERLSQFRKRRSDRPIAAPEWTRDLEFSHRRRQAVLRVARGLADMDGSRDIADRHWLAAQARVADPLQNLRRLFA